MEDNKIVIYQTSDGQTSIDVTLDNDTVWLTQVQMAELFQSTRQNIGLHIKNNEGELTSEATIKESFIVQKEGKRTINRNPV